MSRTFLAFLPSLALALRPTLPARAAAPTPRSVVQLKLPASVDALLDPQVDRAATEPLWKAFRAVYRSEDAAVEALTKNEAVILPFINRPENIKASWAAIKDKFDPDEAAEIVRRNPGILANRPGDLESSSVGEIRASMKFVTLLDGVPPSIRAVIPTITGVTIVGLIAKRVLECQGGICG